VSAERFSFTVGEARTSANHYQASSSNGWALLLGHGAGADQSSEFLVDYARELAERGVDVVTYNFLYTEQGRRVPDAGPALETCCRAAIAAVRARTDGKRLAIGGKSMGGRIATQVAATDATDALVLLGYPLHPPGRPAQLRARHLPKIAAPLLFVQGERDPFGTPDELRPVLDGIPRATLFVVPGGDHSFKVRKKDGVPQSEVHARILDEIPRWLASLR
jgi:predicted alpha/beta-hydrolase family hydrolase